MNDLNMIPSTFEITFKLIANTQVLLSERKHLAEGRWTIPASSFTGLLRHETTMPGAPCFIEELNHAVSEPRWFRFTDLITRNEPVEVTRTKVTINRKTSESSSGVLIQEKILPPGTEFFGKVQFSEEPTGFQRSKVLSSIHEIPIRIGRDSSRGYGDFSIEIINRSRVIIFISYAWEINNTAFMNWVGDLAKRLIEHGFDVIWDQASTSFNLNAEQETINRWMQECINTSDKIIAVLTPEYKTKAVNGSGGVGFEYNNLVLDSRGTSLKLRRYIGILRRGNIDESVPPLLVRQPIYDMRTPALEEKAFSSLVSDLRR